MNKQNRKELEGYVDSLEEIKSNIETMMEEEQEKLDNMPEGLQESERGEAMQEPSKTSKAHPLRLKR